MKKGSIFLVVLVLLSCIPFTCARAVTVESPDLSTGWNIVSVPAIPRNPDPKVVFSNFLVSGSLDQLYRWDSPVGSWVLYDEWSPGVFRGILLAEGYYFMYDPTKYQPGHDPSISFDGITENDTTDMWVSLPGLQYDDAEGGWTIVGCPYSVPYPWEAVKITDGTTTLTVREASRLANPWLTDEQWAWNAQKQSFEKLGLPETFPDRLDMEPWQGYWIRTFKDNLALIFEALPS